MIYLLLVLTIVVALYMFKDNMTIIQLDEHNRMLRVGGGLNEGRPYFRVDLWAIGVRWS